jgi:hypothetical protein
MSIMLTADFHSHSRFSDGHLTVTELVDWYGARGAKVLAVTDHWCQSRTPLGRVAQLLKRTLTSQSIPHYFNTLESESLRAWKTYGMRLIPGVEITQNTLSHSRSAHLLFLAHHAWDLAILDPDLTPMELLLRARRAGFLTIAAHPVSTGRIEAQTYHLWDNRKLYAPYIDAWECGTQERYFAEVAASGLPIIANSDFHTTKQAQAWRTRLNLSLKEQQTLRIPEIFHAIRARRLQPIWTDWRSASPVSGCVDRDISPITLGA